MRISNESILFCMILFKLDGMEICKVDLNSVPDEIITCHIIPNIIQNIHLKLLIINSYANDGINLYSPVPLLIDEDRNSFFNIKLINKRFYKNLNFLCFSLFKFTKTVKDNPKKYLLSSLFSDYQQKLLKPVTFYFERAKTSVGQKNEASIRIKVASLYNYQITFCFKYKLDSIYSFFPIVVNSQSCMLKPNLRVSEQVKKYFDLLNKTVTQLLSYSDNDSGYGIDGLKNGYCRKFFEIYLCNNTEISAHDAILLYALLRQFFLLQKNTIN